MRLTVLSVAFVLVVGHGQHDHDHDHDHNHDHHHDHHHDHNHHDELHSHHLNSIDLDATSWDSVIASDEHVWAVKFHSEMCGSCKAFKPVWEEARSGLDGLHWAAIVSTAELNVPMPL